MTPETETRIEGKIAQLGQNVQRELGELKSYFTNQMADHRLSVSTTVEKLTEQVIGLDNLIRGSDSTISMAVRLAVMETRVADTTAASVRLSTNWWVVIAAICPTLLTWLAIGVYAAAKSGLLTSAGS